VTLQVLVYLLQSYQWRLAFAW